MASYFGNLLFLNLRARLRSAQLVEDVQQETLLRVLEVVRNKGGVEHPERFGAFVNAVSKNVWREFTRSESRHAAMDDYMEEPEDPTVDLDGPLVNFDTKRQVQRVMDELTEKDYALLRAVYLDDLDKGGVCRRHKVKPDYLRVLLYRPRIGSGGFTRTGPAHPLSRDLDQLQPALRFERPSNNRVIGRESANKTIKTRFCSFWRRRSE